jgi:hypothetical protein
MMPSDPEIAWNIRYIYNTKSEISGHLFFRVSRRFILWL